MENRSKRKPKKLPFWRPTNIILLGLLLLDIIVVGFLIAIGEGYQAGCMVLAQAISFTIGYFDNRT